MQPTPVDTDQDSGVPVTVGHTHSPGDAIPTRRVVARAPGPASTELEVLGTALPPACPSGGESGGYVSIPLSAGAMRAALAPIEIQEFSCDTSTPSRSLWLPRR